MNHVIHAFALIGCLLFGSAQAATISQTLQIGDISSGIPDPGSSSVQTNWVTKAVAYTDNYHLPSGSNPTVVSPMVFQQFDTLDDRLILNSVTIDLSGAWIGKLTVSNQAGATSDTIITGASVSVTMLVDIFGW